MASTFDDLAAQGTVRFGRCPICGGDASDPVRLLMHAGRSHGREQTEWLFRRSVSSCEPCAVAAVEAALAALDVAAQSPTTTHSSESGS